MGLKNSKNKVKSALHNPSDPSEPTKSINQTADKLMSDQAVLDDMILFHKVNTRLESQNRSFIDENEETRPVNLNEPTNPDDPDQPHQIKQYGEQLPTSILVYNSNSKFNYNNNLNKNFVKVKSRSEISTRHVIFAQSTQTSNEEVLMTRDKTKFNVRFADKVLVMNSSDLDRLYNETLNNNNNNQTDSIQILNNQKIEKYFISLNDEKLTSAIPRPRKRNSQKNRDNQFMHRENKSAREFERLRSWNIVKENTFYEEDRKSVTA